jgi:hypothetical protein
MKAEGAMEKKGTFIAGILILGALILSLSLIGREKNEIVPPKEGIQAVEEKQFSSRKTSTGAITSPTGGKGLPGRVSSAARPSDGEAGLEKDGDVSSPSADELDTGDGAPSAEAPMSSADFKALVDERKEAAAWEQGPEALEEYRARTEAREKERLSREELRQKLSQYRDERREWKHLMDEARGRARETGDFTEVKRLRDMRPKPPKREPSTPTDQENN